MDQINTCILCKKEFREHIPAMFEHPLLSYVCSQECFDWLINSIAKELLSSKVDDQSNS